ncbi:MAG TPA: hypothetical protein VIY47_07115, partial [Ignavibacteriaceae bacterium]
MQHSSKKRPHGGNPSVASKKRTINGRQDDQDDNIWIVSEAGMKRFEHTFQQATTSASAKEKGYILLRSPCGWSKGNKDNIPQNQVIVSDVQTLKDITGANEVFEIQKAKNQKRETLRSFEESALRDGPMQTSFWETAGSITYGAGLPGNLFPPGKDLFKMLDPMLVDTCGVIPGITESYLYYGRSGTSFGFHKEDVDLHS